MSRNQALRRFQLGVVGDARLLPFGGEDSETREISCVHRRTMSAVAQSFTSSTRRLFWRPSGVELGLTGLVLPNPLV